jgi:type VI protein secretion system component Hcp
VVAALAVSSATARAGLYVLDIHIDGTPDGGDYTPSFFRWSEPFELSFQHSTDNTTANLMALAQTRTHVTSATLHQTFPFPASGTATITLAMTDVVIKAVHEEGGSDGPLETVVLDFKSVTYTFQPLLPNGQKNGPPLSFTWSR